MHRLAGEVGARFDVLVCEADPARMVERLRTRQAEGHDPSDATPQVLAHQLDTAEPLPTDWAGCCHTLRNDGSLDALKAQVQAQLAV